MEGRAQAAMEFLLTYGWALTIAIGATATVVTLDPLELSNPQASLCETDSSVICVEETPLLTENGHFQVQLENTGPRQLNLENFQINNIQPQNVSGTTECTFRERIGPGQRQLVVCEDLPEDILSQGTQQTLDFSFKTYPSALNPDFTSTNYGQTILRVQSERDLTENIDISDPTTTDPSQEPDEYSCYHPYYVGTVGEEEPCEGKLIVDRDLLDKAVGVTGTNGDETQYAIQRGEEYTLGDSEHNVFTGQVTDMSSLFEEQEDFNEDIGYWDTGNVRDMERVFQGASSFNQDISSWNTSNVETMRFMFWQAESFNQDINSWDTSSVQSMRSMFNSAESFNQDLDGWNTSSVQSTRFMFSSASSFDGDIDGWDTSNIENMRRMFADATSFNQDINSWNTSNAENLREMFNGASSFNQDISSWDTSNVETMDRMFRNAYEFNQDISSWSVPNIDSKPNLFDSGAGFEDQDELQPEWEEE